MTKGDGVGSAGVKRGPNVKAKRLVYGVGVNDADYCVVIRDRVAGTCETCPYYDRWHSMLRRCYSKNALERNPTYENCIVCDEWLYFMNFKRWMEKQDWEGKDLDKDILNNGCKVYSPETCIFVDSRINCVTSTCLKVRGQYPIGVGYRKKHRYKKYNARIQDGSKRVFLGDFENPEDAHKAWQKAKVRIMQDFLDNFSNEEDPRLIRSISELQGAIQKDIDNGRITQKVEW